MKRLLAVLTVGLLIGACGPSPQNDPIYQALLANPPTEVPAKFLPELRKEKASIVPCEVFNEGKSNQYVTCWWSTGSPPGSAYFAYYSPSPFDPPRPDNVSPFGGLPVTDSIDF